MAALIPPTVLYVEDDVDDVFFLRRALQRLSVECDLQTVFNVPTAKSYLSGNLPYDDRLRFPMPVLLVTDMTMLPAGESSLDLIIWIRATPELLTLPILCATDNGQPAVHEAMAKHAVTSYPKIGQMLEVANAVKLALSTGRTD